MYKIIIQYEDQNEKREISRPCGQELFENDHVYIGQVIDEMYERIKPQEENVPF